MAHRVMGAGKYRDRERQETKTNRPPLNQVLGCHASCSSNLRAARRSLVPGLLQRVRLGSAHQKGTKRVGIQAA